jgi:hypothetical protein
MWCPRHALLLAFASVVHGCAATYPVNDPPPRRDFSVDDASAGGSGGADLAETPPDLATVTTPDLATATVPDLATGGADLTTACVASVADGGALGGLYLVAPTGGALFAARRRGGVWSALGTGAGNATDVALASVAGRPLTVARLADTSLAVADFDGCRDVFRPLTALAAASTAARPSLVGGGGGDLVFRGAVLGDQRYYWAHFDGSSWGAIATQGNFLSTLPPTALVVGGSVHIIFAGTDTNLYDGLVQTTGGGASTQLAGNTSTFAPAAALAPDGRLHVVYTGTDKHIYWFVAAQPATVHDLCAGQPAGCFILTDAAPTLAIAGDGDPVTVFHGSDGKLYASRLAVTQWSAAVNISGGETATPAWALSGGGDDLADVVYARASDNLPRHAALTAGGWQTPVTVGAQALGGAPALAVAP